MAQPQQNSLAMPLAVGMGVVGGLAIGSWAVEHLFVRGLTAHERKNLLVFVGGSLALWGAQQFVDIDNAWSAAEQQAENAWQAAQR